MVLPKIADDVFEYCRQSEALVEKGMSRADADEEIRRKNPLLWGRFRTLLQRWTDASESRW